jgi:hypothetical protein
MTDLATSDVFLVGSVPVASDDSQEVFRLCAAALGDRVFALPDGETGARRMWIGALGETTFSRHPDLEDAPDLGAPFGGFRVKSGVTSISLQGLLPYADAALASWKTFTQLRAAGEVPAGVRLQMSVPTPHAAVGGYFADVETEWPLLMGAYRAAIVADIERVLDVIPAEDLAIQWDFCTELVDIVGADVGQRVADEVWPWNPGGSADEKLEQHTSAQYVAPLSASIPPQTLLGYHICLGTWPQAPAVPARDLTRAVQAANALVANTPRAVDFLHLPSVRDADREFFAPLADLDVASARVFIGVESKDGREALVRRAGAAREFLPSFGVSHYCGYGRDLEDEMPDLLSVLRDGADELARI